MTPTGVVLLACVLVLASAQAGGMEPVQTWKEGEAPDACVVQCLTVTGDGQVIAGTMEAGIFRSADAARTWRSAGPPRSVVLSLLTLAGGDLLAGTFGNGILRSQDGGESWVPDNEGLTDPEVTAIAGTPAGVLYVGTSRGGVFRRAPGETKWQSAGLSGSFIISLAVSRHGAVVAGTAGKGIGVSRNGGLTWVKVEGDLLGRDIRAVTVDCEDALYAAVGGLGVIRSRDGGASWSPLNTGLGSVNVGSLACTREGGLLAGTTSGVYRMTLERGAWEKTDGLQAETPIRCVAFGRGSSFLAGTVGGKILTMALAIPGLSLDE